MEKPEDFTLQSAPYSSQRLQSNSGTTVENRAPPHGVRMFQADKPGQAPISSGNFQSASTLGHGSTANSASLPYQLPTSEIRPVTHAGLTTGNLGKDNSPVALPRVERPHFRPDGRSNGASHIQGNICLQVLEYIMVISCLNCAEDKFRIEIEVELSRYYK